MFSVSDSVQYICCCTLSLTVIARYDAENSHVYIGDSMGQITVLKVTAEMSHQVDTMKKHTGTVVVWTIVRCCILRRVVPSNLQCDFWTCSCAQHLDVCLEFSSFYTNIIIIVIIITIKTRVMLLWRHFRGTWHSQSDKCIKDVDSFDIKIAIQRVLSQLSRLWSLVCTGVSCRQKVRSE